MVDAVPLLKATGRPCLLSWAHATISVVRCPFFVGRNEELAALAEIFSRAAGGRGACAIVIGEAGVGKTRLVTEAADGARERGQVVLVGRSTPTDRFSPLRPVGEALLDGLRDWRPPDDPVLAPYLRPAAVPAAD